LSSVLCALLAQLAESLISLPGVNHEPEEEVADAGKRKPGQPIDKEAGSASPNPMQSLDRNPSKTR
jgi:hypothetical protein